MLGWRCRRGCVSCFAAGAGAFKVPGPLLAQPSRLWLGLLEGKRVLARDWFRAAMPDGLVVGAGFLASAARAALPSISPSGASDCCDPMALTWETEAACRRARWRKEGSARRRTVWETPVFIQAWCRRERALSGCVLVPWWCPSTADGMPVLAGRLTIARKSRRWKIASLQFASRGHAKTCTVGRGIVGLCVLCLSHPPKHWL